MTIMQGDEYSISFNVKIDGQPVDISKVEKVEFVIGEMVKKYPSVVRYDTESQKFVLYLTQRETFSFSSAQEVQLRVKLKSGEVIGEKVGTISVIKSSSQEVL